jgi:hypothetical protein
MGHGHYYLYELRGRSLKCLLKTFAVDSHADCNLIRGDTLDVSYTIYAATEITFTGIIDEYDDDPHNQRPIASTPCRKVFRWHRNEDRFIEERSQRFGFEAYADRQ